MNAALVGYGKMGREIEKILTDRRHKVVLVIDDANRGDLNTEKLRASGAQVAFEFSTPETAFGNIEACIKAGVAVVSGTTGWLDRLEDIEKLCEKVGGAFFYASNFSLGMNIFFEINEALARMMNRHPDYEVKVEETHHVHKIDAPSGTAITLANAIAANVDRKEGWVCNEEGADGKIGITAKRVGEVPGTHIVTWDSAVDSIVITHEAKSRKSLALGAVMAGEFIRDKKGVFGMKDMLDI